MALTKTIMIDYTILQNSLRALESQFRNYQNMDEHLEVYLREALQESVIQRFELCYDCLWKTLKRYLSEVLGIPDLQNSPKPLFREANKQNLLSSPFEKWCDYIDTRNTTSHVYSAEKAQECLALIENFIDDAIGLYQSMSEQGWQQ